MAQETEATPRPWVLSPDHHQTLIRGGNAATGRRVATAFMNTAPSALAENEANAALIVRAVNERDELLAALAEIEGAMTRWWGNYETSRKPMPENTRNAIDRARRALALSVGTETTT